MIEKWLKDLNSSLELCEQHINGGIPSYANFELGVVLGYVNCIEDTNMEVYKTLPLDKIRELNRTLVNLQQAEWNKD